MIRPATDRGGLEFLQFFRLGFAVGFVELGGEVEPLEIVGKGGAAYTQRRELLAPFGDDAVLVGKGERLGIHRFRHWRARDLGERKGEFSHFRSRRANGGDLCWRKGDISPTSMISF